MAITAQGTMAKSGVQPRELHAGTISVVSVYSCTATPSSGDIYEMLKLPDGAKVIDMILSTTGDLAGSPGKFNVGTASDHDLFIASASANATAPVHINVQSGTGGSVGYLSDTSDDATTQYTMVRIKASDTGAGSSTAAVVITLAAVYYMDKEH